MLDIAIWLIRLALHDPLIFEDFPLELYCTVRADFVLFDILCNMQRLAGNLIGFYCTFSHAHAILLPKEGIVYDVWN